MDNQQSINHAGIEEYTELYLREFLLPIYYSRLRVRAGGRGRVFAITVEGKRHFVFYNTGKDSYTFTPPLPSSAFSFPKPKIYIEGCPEPQCQWGGCGSDCPEHGVEAIYEKKGRVVFTGPRDWGRPDFREKYLARRTVEDQGSLGFILVEGGADGLDQIVRDYAGDMKFPCETYKPPVRGYGRMLNLPNVIRVMAFRRGKEWTRETGDCVKQAVRLDIPVMEIEYP